MVIRKADGYCTQAMSDNDRIEPPPNVWKVLLWSRQKVVIIGDGLIGQRTQLTLSSWVDQYDVFAVK